MTQPVRIRLRRVGGFDLQAHSSAINGLPAVNVARPGKWGNPYVVGAPDPWTGRCMSQERVVELFRRGIEGGYLTIPFTRLTPEERGDGLHSFGAHAIKEVVHQLRGKNLACWCKQGDLCHAHVLLELANA